MALSIDRETPEEESVGILALKRKTQNTYIILIDNKTGEKQPHK